MNQSELLKMGLEQLEIKANETQFAQLLEYAQQILRWNKRSNLVKADDKSIISHHILDSLAPLGCFSQLKPKSLLDVGSGAGLPGIPLAVFLTNTNITLCERMSKRTGFLENMKLQLGLNHVEVYNGEYQNIDKNYDIITMRAFASLSDCLKTLSEKLRDNGRIMAYKGKMETVEQELTEINSKHYSWKITKIKPPDVDGQRHIVILKKVN